MDDYYKKIIYIPQVNQDDKILGKIERWEAHKKGILHRGFTAILIYKDQVILQKRRHPVFDSYWDISFSSHPIFIGEKIISDKEVILQTLKREWQLKEEVKEIDITYLDKFYYQAKDEKSGLTEHEIDYLYLVNLKAVPDFNKKYAYEMRLIDRKMFKDPNSLSFLFKNFQFAPWIKLDIYQRRLT